MNLLDEKLVNSTFVLCISTFEILNKGGEAAKSCLFRFRIHNLIKVNVLHGEKYDSKLKKGTITD